MNKHVVSLLLLALLLGSHKGYLALFPEGSTEPMQIFPCPVTSLPPFDQAQLEEGIPIRSETELAQRLEDYMS